MIERGANLTHTDKVGHNVNLKGCLLIVAINNNSYYYTTKYGFRQVNCNGNKKSINNYHTLN